MTRTESADYYEGNLKPHDHSLCICCGIMADINILGIKDYIESQISGNIVSFDLKALVSYGLC